MKPEQMRERMELFGFGMGKTEEDLFLKEVCSIYEDMYYNLMEKEDKLHSLNDAIKYYKNMESNITQMLSTLSEISEKTEQTAEKTAQLTIKEAESKADMILAQASQEAAQILEEAKQEAEEIIENAKIQEEDIKKGFSGIQQEFEAYALRFYDFIEAQKLYFEEHKIDVETIRKETKKEETDTKKTEPAPSPAITILPVSVPLTAPLTTSVPPQISQQLVPPIPQETVNVSQSIPPIIPPETIINKEDIPVIPPMQVEEKTAVLEEPAAIHTSDPVTVNQIRKIPNTTAQKSPSMEEIEANIPEHIRNIPISDHTETLDEIIQSIKKSYEEVENK